MPDDSVKLRLRFKLSTQQANLMQLLMNHKVASPDLINERLNAATETRVAVHRLRKTLEPFGIRIEAKRSFGYWISAEDKDRVRQQLSEGE